MTRKLSTTWRVENHGDMEFHISDELVAELGKNIQKEIDQEIMFDLYKASGWKSASIAYTRLDEAKKWVEENKFGEVKWFDNRVAFEKSEDYEWFMLRWS